MAEQAVLVAEVLCPGCDAPNLRSSTVCGECGEHLFVRGTHDASSAFVPSAGSVDVRCLDVRGCTCGSAGICTACVFYLLDNGLPL